MSQHLFGTKNTCVEDLDTSHRNTGTVARVVEGCTHAGTIDDCNPKIWHARVCRYGGAAVFMGGLFMFVIPNRRHGV